MQQNQSSTLLSDFTFELYKQAQTVTTKAISKGMKPSFDGKTDIINKPINSKKEITAVNTCQIIALNALSIF